MAKTMTDGIIDDHDYDTYCHHRFRRHGLILLGGMSGRGGTKFEPKWLVLIPGVSTNPILNVTSTVDKI